MNALLIVLAVIPGIVLAIMVYRLDKIDKESPKTLLLLFALGALSIIPALIFEILGENVIKYLFPQNSDLYLLIENIIGVACVEEAGKYVALRTVWKKPDFNYRFDAVVYSVMVTLGFAVFENISYAYSFGLSTTISRAFTAVPAHTIFGIFMGHYYGQAKYWLYHGEHKKCKQNLWLAYLVPVLLHGFYDYFASKGTALSTFMFLGLVVAMDIIAIVKIRRYSREDTPIAPWDSPIPVVGWFPEDGNGQQPTPVNPYGNGIQPNPAYNPGQVYTNVPAQGYMPGQPGVPGQYANPVQQQYMPGQYANPVQSGMPGQYINPAQQPNMPGQYANPMQPGMPGQYVNPAQQPANPNQYINVNNARPQNQVVYNPSMGNNYVNMAPPPTQGYTPSRAYRHAEANLENLSEEGYSLNSFVENDPSNS